MLKDVYYKVLALADSTVKKTESLESKEAVKHPSPAKVTDTSLMVCWFRYWFSQSPTLREFLKKQPVSELALELCCRTDLGIDTSFSTIAEAPMAVHPVGYRVLYIHEQLNDPSNTQIIVLGSGLTTYAVDFAKPGRTFFEMDLNGDQLRQKSAFYETLESAPISTTVFRQGNYVEEFEKISNNTMFDPTKKTLVVWEGNVMYLKPADIQKTMTNIADAFNANSSANVEIIADHFSQPLVDFHKTTAPQSLGDEELEAWAVTSVGQAFITGYAPNNPAFKHRNWKLIAAPTHRETAKRISREEPVSTINDHSGMLHYKLISTVK